MGALYKEGCNWEVKLSKYLANICSFVVQQYNNHLRRTNNLKYINGAVLNFIGECINSDYIELY